MSPAQPRTRAEAAVSIRLDLDRLVGELTAVFGNDPAWLVSSAFTRNPHQSPLYRNCLRLALGEPVDEIPRRARALARFFLTAIRLFRFWTAHRLEAPPTLPQEPVVLLDGFLLDSDFENGSYRDRYYPNLREHLSEREKRRVCALPEIFDSASPRTLIRAGRNSPEPFLFKGHFLTLTDCLAALWAPIPLIFKKIPPIFFRGKDVSVFIKKELLETAWNRQSTIGFLNDRFALRLSQSGMKVSLLIDWFENQAADAGLNLGFNRHLPGTKTAGYCGYILSPEQKATMAPTPAEAAAGILPRRFLVSGSALVEEWKKDVPSLDVRIAPALRFAHVWREAPPRKKDLKRLLVVLPMEEKTRDAMLSMLESLRETRALDDLRVLIKPHPTLTVDALRRIYPAAWPQGFETAAGDFSAQIRQAEILLGAGSSALLEALALGVPAIAFDDGGGVLRLPIPESVPAEFRPMVSNAEEAAATLASLRTADERFFARLDAEALRIRRSFFKETDAASVREFLNL